MIGLIGPSATSSPNHTQLQRYRSSTHFQFTVAHALGFSVPTSRILATDLNTETSTSNYYEAFLPFLVQSPWNLGTQLKLCLLFTPPAYDCKPTTFVVPYKPSARTCRKHVMCSLSTVVWRHCLRGSVFTEPLPRNGLHNLVVLLLRTCVT
jgi:hypothetical protein